LSGQEKLIEKQLLKEKPMDRTPFWFSFFVYGEKPRWIDRMNTFNASNVSFKQVIFPVLLDRTNVRVCHHSRPICVSDVCGIQSKLRKIEPSIASVEKVLIA